MLVDQRGCGKSTPFACLEENTTWDLVEDFEKIRAHLHVDRWQIFGGSWGSTLGLAYAVTHPDRVLELVLRGIFLCRQKELDFLYEDRVEVGVYWSWLTTPFKRTAPVCQRCKNQPEPFSSRRARLSGAGTRARARTTCSPTPGSRTFARAG